MKAPKLTISQVCKFELALCKLADEHGLEVEETGGSITVRVFGKKDDDKVIRHGFVLREK